MNRALTAALVVCGIAVSGFIGVRYFNDGKAPYNEVNIPAPNMVIPPLHTKMKGINPKDFIGKVTLVSFFASWCPSCHVNHEALKHLSATPAVRIVGIALRDQSINLQMWLMQHGNPFESIGFDQTAQSAQAWGVKGIPQMFLVDKKGMIRAVFVGALSQERMEKDLLPLALKLANEAE